jgi:hypothetical protein
MDLTSRLVVLVFDLETDLLEVEGGMDENVTTVARMEPAPAS